MSLKNKVEILNSMLHGRRKNVVNKMHVFGGLFGNQQSFQKYLSDFSPKEINYILSIMTYKPSKNIFKLGSLFEGTSKILDSKEDKCIEETTSPRTYQNINSINFNEFMILKNSEKEAMIDMICQAVTDAYHDINHPYIISDLMGRFKVSKECAVQAINNVKNMTII